MGQPELILLVNRPALEPAPAHEPSVEGPEAVARSVAPRLHAAVELAVSNWPGEVFLGVAPDLEPGMFRDLEREFCVKLIRQAERDPGARMLSALRAGIARQGAAALMGCGMPQGRWDVLDQANDWLAYGRNVLGPTEDGGYYLIGLTQVRPELFTDIPWEAPEVLSLTLRRAEEVGIEFELLPTLYETDTPPDLRLLGRRHSVAHTRVIPLSELKPRGR